jgi:hypothetical protein
MLKCQWVMRPGASRRAALFVMCLFIASHLSSVMDSATTLSQRRSKTSKPKAQQRRLDNSHFSHQTHFVEQKLPCESCHKFPSSNWKEIRQDGEAFPDVTEYPDHQSCLDCHRQQFFARERPAPRICSHCHLKATPRDTSRYPFPSVGDKFFSSAKATNFVSDFRVYFPHYKHLDVISKNVRPRESGLRFIRASFAVSLRPVDESDPKSCATCHVTLQPQGASDDEFLTKPPNDHGDSFWLKKGTFKTRPKTHSACFTCHNQESELAPLPQDCNACHKLLPTMEPADFDPQLPRKMGIADWYTLTAWRARQSAGAFRHEAHDMSCTKCHNVGETNPGEAKSVKVPVRSCGGEEGCHATATADEGGILNHEIDQRKTNDKFVCVKCHIAFGTKPVPKSHSELIVKSR